MGRILTTGEIPLCGETVIQGSKNAALPLMAASVLHRGKTVLYNCPRILDVEYMGAILRELGCSVSHIENTLEIDASGELSFVVSETWATKLRASVLLMGSLLGRCGRVCLPYPGGCTIGRRPIDLHIRALTRMGAQVAQTEKGIFLELPKGKTLRGAYVKLPFPSVGATENALLGAVLAEGETQICGCAKEPEIECLCRFLQEKGVHIRGVGGETLEITGQKNLRDCAYHLPADRIVAGTYLLAAVGTRGHVTLRGTTPKHLAPLLPVLEESGASLHCGEDFVEADAKKAARPVLLVRTLPWPGFPTDLQSQLMTALCLAKGVSRIEENMFESRYLIARELAKMGADIKAAGKYAVVTGVQRLHAADLTASELRGGAALVSAGLMAEGETAVSGGGFIRRGYEDIVRDYAGLGANIRELT